MRFHEATVDTIDRTILSQDFDALPIPAIPSRGIVGCMQSSQTAIAIVYPGSRFPGWTLTRTGEVGSHVISTTTYTSTLLARNRWPLTSKFLVLLKKTPADIPSLKPMQLGSFANIYAAPLGLPTLHFSSPGH